MAYTLSEIAAGNAEIRKKMHLNTMNIPSIDKACFASVYILKLRHNKCATTIQFWVCSCVEKKKKQNELADKNYFSYRLTYQDMPDKSIFFFLLSLWLYYNQ